MLLVESKLKEFCKAVKEAHKTGEDTTVLLHQDAFAGDYQDDEFYLLGCAIKYAGEFNVPVTIIGKSQETINENLLVKE